MHFYTSINNNYLPKARVLAKSVKRYCPNSRFSLVLSDILPEDVDPRKEPFDEIVFIDDLGIPVKNLKQWIYIHSVVELCTAVKGQALVKFLEEGSEKVVYLDPDIVVFDDLSELDRILDTYDVVLTPHQTVPEENIKDVINNEICSLKHGTYNYGFYAVRNTENGLAYARWWRDRLVNFCYDDIPGGIFTDQKWGDIVPALFDNVCIWKNPACNVSTWNLTHRLVTCDENGKYFVNGFPLQFYHFSGFDSGAQKEQLDLYGGKSPVLFDLREWYIKRMNEEEQEKYGKYACVYNYYDNGDLITKVERITMRNRMDLMEYFKDTDPRLVEQEKSYYKWYRSEIGDPAQAEKNPQDAIMELERIYASRSWKLVMFLKRIKMFIFRK